MNDYKCSKCNENFINKSLHDRHIKRKTSCIVHYIKNDDKTYNCKYCLKKFARSSNVKLHIDTCIEKIKFDKDNEIKEYKQALDDRDIKLEEKDKKIELLKKELDDAHIMLVKLDKRKKKSINHSINNTNSNNTNTNSNNNITNNFIVNFGEETISKLTQKDKKEILDNCLYSIIKCAEKVHFNDNIPEQQNSYLTNMKADYGYKFIDGKFIATDLDELIDTIIENRKEDVRNILENRNHMKLSKITIDKINELLDKLDNNEGDIEYIRKEIKLLLYNNREKIINNKLVIN
jgi:hypothetical protein